LVGAPGHHLFVKHIGRRFEAASVVVAHREASDAASIGAHGAAFDRRRDLNIVALALRNRLGIGIAAVGQDTDRGNRHDRAEKFLLQVGEPDLDQSFRPIRMLRGVDARQEILKPGGRMRFPIVGKVWTTTTQDLADRILNL
jgi:hypothetical protein